MMKFLSFVNQFPNTGHNRWSEVKKVVLKLALRLRAQHKKGTNKFSKKTSLRLEVTLRNENIVVLAIIRLIES